MYDAAAEEHSKRNSGGERRGCLVFTMKVANSTKFCGYHAKGVIIGDGKDDDMSCGAGGPADATVCVCDDEDCTSSSSFTIISSISSSENECDESDERERESDVPKISEEDGGGG